MSDVTPVRRSGSTMGPSSGASSPGLRIEGSSPDGLGGRTSTTAIPKWTWTDKAREDLKSEIQRWWDNGGEPGEDDEGGEWVVLPDAVLDALAPHVARHVARQVAEAESLAADTYARLLDMTAQRDALRRQVDAVKAFIRFAHAYPVPGQMQSVSIPALEQALAKARETVLNTTPIWDGEPGGTAPWGVQD